MSVKELATNAPFLSFVQRLAVIVGLFIFLCFHPDDKTAWTALGGVVVDLFHSARNGNGNGAYANGTASGGK